MSNLKKIIKEIITECLNEIKQEKSSTNGVDLYDLLKTTSFISYIDKPSGKYYNHIDLKLKDETHLKMLDDFLNNHNWYIRDGHNMNYTISQTYVDDAIVKTPKILYHATPTMNVENILKNGIYPKSDDIRHKYPPRIYVMDNISTLKSLVKELKRWKNNDEYSILQINTNNLDFDLYVDDSSAYKGSFYIQNIDKIPPNNIKIIEY